MSKHQLNLLDCLLRYIVILNLLTAIYSETPYSSVTQYRQVTPSKNPTLSKLQVNDIRSLSLWGFYQLFPLRVIYTDMNKIKSHFKMSLYRRRAMWLSARFGFGFTPSIRYNLSESTFSLLIDNLIVTRLGIVGSNFHIGSINIRDSNYSTRLIILVIGIGGNLRSRYFILADQPLCISNYFSIGLIGESIGLKVGIRPLLLLQEYDLILGLGLEFTAITKGGPLASGWTLIHLGLDYKIR